MKWLPGNCKGNCETLDKILYALCGQPDQLCMVKQTEILNKSLFCIKYKSIGVAELRLQLHQAIDTITDSKKLEAIYTLLQDTKGPYKPMSLKEYVGAIDEARQQIKEGKYTNIDDLEKESESW